MLVEHVPPPVILAREALTAAPRVGASRLQAVILASLLVLIVYVPVEVRLGAELLAAIVMGALVWAFMVALVMAVAKLAKTMQDVQRPGGRLLQLVYLVKTSGALVACVHVW